MNNRELMELGDVETVSVNKERSVEELEELDRQGCV